MKTWIAHAAAPESSFGQSALTARRLGYERSLTVNVVTITALAFALWASLVPPVTALASCPEFDSDLEIAMPKYKSPVPSASEARALQLLMDPGASRDQFLGVLRGTPAGQWFVMKREWKAIVRNAALSEWRRLAALQVLLERVIACPCTLASFVTDALTPLGIGKEQLIDMSMASFVPVHRDSNTAVFMAELPFKSSKGSTAVYIAVDRTNNRVREAAIYPGIEEMRS